VDHPCYHRPGGPAPSIVSASRSTCQKHQNSAASVWVLEACTTTRRRALSALLNCRFKIQIQTKNCFFVLNQVSGMGFQCKMSEILSCSKWFDRNIFRTSLCIILRWWNPSNRSKIHKITLVSCVHFLVVFFLRHSSLDPIDLTSRNVWGMQTTFSGLHYSRLLHWRHALDAIPRYNSHDVFTTVIANEQRLVTCIHKYS